MDELKLIKKYYGEDFMHYAREHFSTILEQEGVLLDFLLTHFYPQKRIYRDLLEYDKQFILDEFNDYIYRMLDSDKKEEKEEVTKTPSELLSEAGYILYECKSEEDIQYFRKYYAPGEELCTFNGGRLKTNYVFFAVKKNVDKIKREDFLNPERQDLYGTSVISIQFSCDEAHHLSIKNRYNHTVLNPDATFSNNLDHIIPGLTDAFTKFYHLEQKHEQDYDMPGYVLACDGMFYPYNYEINNIYYCPDNVIINNGAVKIYSKERYIVMNYFILDMKEKKIELIDDEIEDSFIESIGSILKVEIKKEEDKRIVVITNTNNEQIIIKLNLRNEIVGYIHPFIKVIGNDFLINDETLEEFEAPSLEEIGVGFLYHNFCLEKLVLPSLKKVGDDFMRSNEGLEEFEAPSLEEVGNQFLYSNSNLRILILKSLRKIGNYFLYENKILKIFVVENLDEIGDHFLFTLFNKEEFYAPKLNKREKSMILSRVRRY